MESLGYSFETPRWTFQIRSCFASVCELFSEFSLHLAPTYHHDRCERSVQMRLYTLNKRHFFLVFVGFAFTFLLTVFIGLAGPPILKSVHENATSQRPSQSGPYALSSPIVSTFNQQLWVISKISLQRSKTETKLEMPLNIAVKVLGIHDPNDPSRMTQVYKNTAHNRSRSLKCSQHGCDDIIILHLGYLGYSVYRITVNIYTSDRDVHFKDVQFEFKTYNSSFTQFQIWFRFVFLVLTFIVTCLFAHSLRRFSMRDWSIEQRWMSLLLPLLLLYNNPFFPLLFLVNSALPGILDGVFQATFLTVLLLFWLCLYHGVRQTKRRFLIFYAPKLLIVGLMWIVAIMITCWQHYKEIADPTYNYKSDTGNFFGFKIFFFIVGSIYLVYLLYLVVRAYAELRNMPYFDVRLKFLTVLMLIVVVVTITITSLRFGSSVLEENFVAELSTHYENSAEFLAFYGLLNFYLYTMAFVYSPAKNAVLESHFKDDPSLTMLNDSDEEVIYGAESEQQALTRKQFYDSEEEAFNN